MPERLRKHAIESFGTNPERHHPNMIIQMGWGLLTPTPQGIFCAPHMGVTNDMNLQTTLLHIS